VKLIITAIHPYFGEKITSDFLGKELFWKT
jgi:hypothetical protein